MNSFLRGLVVSFCLGVAALAQEPASSPQSEQAQTAPGATCLEPVPLVRWEDYNGPLAKTAAILARKLERKSTSTLPYKSDDVFCTLEIKEKFHLFLSDSYDPLAFLSAGFNAALDQAQNNDRQFGQGSAGYSKRFAANYAGQTTGLFFGEFLYPMVFQEDPRYYRLGHGTTTQRFFHATAHTLVAHRDSGGKILNFSEWLGTASSVFITQYYHPGSDRRPGAAGRNIGFSIATDMGYDILREFWPEIAHRFKLPFRDRAEAVPAY